MKIELSNGNTLNAITVKELYEAMCTLGKENAIIGISVTLKEFDENDSVVCMEYCEEIQPNDIEIGGYYTGIRNHECDCIWFNNHER